MDADDLYRLLRNAHLQAQGVIDTLRDPLVVLDSSLCVLNASQAFYETFEVSRDETIGHPFYNLGNGQWDIPELRELLERVLPKSASVVDYEVRASFPGIGPRTMLVSARRLVHPDISARVILLSIVDATERQRRDAEKDIVIGELRHRMKNMLAVVVSLARQTTTAGRSAEAYRDAFIGRLEALVRANGLSMDSDQPVALEHLVRVTLEPYAAPAHRVELTQAPEVSLPPDQVVPVSLILHELATNAVKHGALSTPAGRLQIGWTIGASDESSKHLTLTWRESDGPEVTAPDGPGFGTRLIDFAILRDLGGSVERSYGPDGLSVEIRFPI
jgi:two-component sensor histidine kinase